MNASEDWYQWNDFLTSFALKEMKGKGCAFDYAYAIDAFRDVVVGSEKNGVVAEENANRGGMRDLISKRYGQYPLGIGTI